MPEQNAPCDPTTHFTKLQNNIMRAILDPEITSDQQKAVICTIVNFLGGANKNPPDSDTTAKESN